MTPSTLSALSFVTPPEVVFLVLAAVAVATAGGMILARNTVHAVLLMAAHFIVTAVLYLMLAAPFLAVVQVMVYAGAIMVLFLFVVMLMGPGAAPGGETLRGQRLLGVPLAAVLAVVLALMGAAAGLARPMATPEGSGPGPGAPAPGFGSAAAIGRELLTHHVLGLEVVSVLLLVAMIGAVVIGRFGDGEA